MMQTRIRAQPATPLRVQAIPHEEETEERGEDRFCREDDRGVGRLRIALPNHLGSEPDGHRNRAGVDNRQQSLANSRQGDHFAQPGAEQADQSADQELSAGDQEWRRDAVGDASDKEHVQGPENGAGNYPGIADQWVKLLGAREQPGPDQAAERRRPHRPVRSLVLRISQASSGTSGT
jgi:hypothetical protein